MPALKQLPHSKG